MCILVVHQLPISQQTCQLFACEMLPDILVTGCNTVLQQRRGWDPVSNNLGLGPTSRLTSLLHHHALTAAGTPVGASFE